MRLFVPPLRCVCGDEFMTWEALVRCARSDHWRPERKPLTADDAQRMLLGWWFGRPQGDPPKEGT